MRNRTNKISEISVFFPLYNEEKNVKKLVKSSATILSKLAHKYEIILVNDGSTDNTQKLALAESKKNENVRVISQENKGYGGALKTGFESCRYEWVFFSDGDLQFDLSELSEFIKETNTNKKVIIGYRANRVEGFTRKFIMTALKLWNKIFFNFPIYIKDIDCAFKLIHRDVLKKVLPLMSDGAMISTELLLKITDLGIKPIQIPVSHLPRVHGEPSGSNPKVILRAVTDTFKLRKTMGYKSNVVLNIAFAALIFLTFLPISADINYMQNDEYTHYLMIEKFMQGDFVLDDYMGATFYFMGLIALPFAMLFGATSLPVLTLIVSVLSVFVLINILQKHMEIGFFSSIIFGLTLLFNPLFLYSTFGFMTENYFVFTLLLSVWFFYEFVNNIDSASTNLKYSNFFLMNLFVLFSYLVRQFGLVTPIAFSAYLIIKRKFKYAILQLFYTACLFVFHFKFFPITPQMYDARLSFDRLLEFEQWFTLGSVYLIYLGIFVLPIVFIGTIRALTAIKLKNSFLTLIFLGIVIVFIGASYKSFDLEDVNFVIRERSGKIRTVPIQQEFPYLKNVFEREGLYSDTIEGTKHTYPGYFDLFTAFDVLGKFGAILILIYLAFYYKDIFSFEFAYCFGLLFLLLVSPRVFDRYLLPVFVIFLVFLAKSVNLKALFDKVLVCLFLFVFAGYGYISILDLHNVHKYVWSTSESLVKMGVPPQNIKAGNSWENYNRQDDRYWEYKFAYMNNNINNDNTDNPYVLIDSYRVEFLLNPYIDPVIHLYYKADIEN